jgi:hypothetical protein
MRSRKCVVMSGPIAVAAMLAVGCSQPSGQPAPAPASANPPAAAAATAPPTQSTAASPGPPAAAAPPASAAAPAPAATDQAGPTEHVLASQPYNQNPQLRCDILEVRRVSGGALLIRWREIRPGAQNAGLAAGQEQGIAHSWSWNGVYFTDPVENKKYLGLKDSAGDWLGEGNDKTYGPGDQQMMWMKFPAPPPTSNKISFVFPGFPPFEDLPVS